jgi:hypothetical protein
MFREYCRQPLIWRHPSQFASLLAHVFRLVFALQHFRQTAFQETSLDPSIAPR